MIIVGMLIEICCQLLLAVSHYVCAYSLVFSLIEIQEVAKYLQFRG